MTDPTGSRRYICLSIPDGLFINNTGEIDYGQLYAQVIYELNVTKTPYWFSNEEVARIQQLNQNYLEQKDIAEMVEVCFRKPKEGETAKMMNSKMLLMQIQKDYPSVEINHGNKVRIKWPDVRYDVRYLLGFMLGMRGTSDEPKWLEMR